MWMSCLPSQAGGHSEGENRPLGVLATSGGSASRRTHLEGLLDLLSGVGVLRGCKRTSCNVS